MVEIKFNILEEDMDRLWTLKEKRGENSMTGNQFAKELLVETLHRLQPRIPKDDEQKFKNRWNIEKKKCDFFAW